MFKHQVSNFFIPNLISKQNSRTGGYPNQSLSNHVFDYAFTSMIASPLATAPVATGITEV